jgi:predicted nuclease with TOPRIM domain
MNDLEALKKEIQELNTKRIRLETLVEQAKQKCEEIESKYNISNEQELKELLDKAEEKYKEDLEKAVIYVMDVKNAMQPYESIL